MPYSVDFLSIFEAFNLYELLRAVSRKELNVKVSAIEGRIVNPQITAADKCFTILLLNLTLDVLIALLFYFFS